MELCDLKRIRDASSPDSLASRLFRRAWGHLAATGRHVQTAMETTADALAAARLGGVDAGVLASVGLFPTSIATVLQRSLQQVSGPIDPKFAAILPAFLGAPQEPHPAPAFAETLIRQPRAGATCPGKPRIVLEPPENHGDHCLVVAVLGAVLAPHFGARSEMVFLAGLAHHLHNAVLPDSGFAGEVLLGEHLDAIIAGLFERELATLPDSVAAVTRQALAFIPDASTPEGRAFHAADVIDRVLQMRHYDQVARFTIDQALDDMDLVHVGPVQAFHHQVLQDAGLP